MKLKEILNNTALFQYVRVIYNDQTYLYGKCIEVIEKLQTLEKENATIDGLKYDDMVVGKILIITNVLILRIR